MVIRKNCFGDALYWYQKKISAYDQQQWEKKVEERMLNGIHFDVARKVAKQKTELIDLDLIRGSAFSKAKSKQSWLTSTYFGVVRVCLFPFYLRWWTDQSSRAVSIGLLILWALQASAMFVYFSCDQLNDSDKFQTIPLSELIGPLVMFFILGSIHSQISAGTLMSLKNKHLTKNPVPSTTNNSNGIGSIRTFKLDTKDESLRRSSNVNSSSAATDNHQTTDQPSNGTMSNVLHNVSHCFNLNQKPTLLLPDESNMLQLNSRGKKAKFVTKPNVLRKRKKMLASARSLMVTNNGSTDDCSMLISADITSCEDLSPYSTFHGQLNDRLDHLLACENSQQVLLDEEDEDDDEDELQSARTRGSLRIPIVSHNSTKMKSAHSSTSASLSNFSTDASGCRTALRSTDFAGKRSKETQCELGSSSESDRGMPPSPIKLLNDWPMINSDCSSDEDDDDDDDDDDDEDDNEEDEDVDDIENVNESKQLAEQLADGRTKVESGNYAFGFDPYDDGRSDLRRSTKALDQDNETDLKFATNRPRTRSRTIDSELNSNVRGRNPCLINDKKDHGNCKSANCKEDSQLPSLNTKNDQSDQISCSMYQHNEWRKMELSVLDISSIVIRKVASHTHSNEYFYLGVCCSLLLAIMPQIFRLQQNCPVLGTNGNGSLWTNSVANANETLLGSNSMLLNHLQPLVGGSVAATCGSISASNSTKELIEFLHLLPVIVVDLVFSIFSNPTYTWQMQYVVIVACLQRFFLSLLFFFFLCVAERTFRERLLYAKHFSHMTSARRAKKAELPHFRLNKVRNIKSWLSVRSYLKRHGPQRSVNCIVSTSFILAVTILTFLCIQLLKEAEICTGKLYCYEMVFWNMAIGVYIMRLIILGSKINRKYRSNLSVLLTEQINLYLKLEQKPHKKEELTLANNVIKLACDLIKELEVPFKISGFSANPYLYNITKVIVLSAFSSLLSEILGFKLKLTKIKLSG